MAIAICSIRWRWRWRCTALFLAPLSGSFPTEAMGLYSSTPRPSLLRLRWRFFTPPLDGNPECTPRNQLTKGLLRALCPVDKQRGIRSRWAGRAEIEGILWSNQFPFWHCGAIVIFNLLTVHLPARYNF